MRAGVDVDEDAVSREAMGTVAGDSLVVIEMRTFEGEKSICLPLSICAESMSSAEIRWTVASFRLETPSSFSGAVLTQSGVGVRDCGGLCLQGMEFAELPMTAFFRR